jgi:hypothetical protein
MTDKELAEIKLKCLEIAVASHATDVKEFANKLFNWVISGRSSD